MVGVFSAEATLWERAAHPNGNIHMFLATVADGKTTVSWGEGQKNCKAQPESVWMGPNWVGPWVLVD